MTKSIEYTLQVPPRGPYSVTLPAQVAQKQSKPRSKNAARETRDLLAQLVAQVAELNERVAHLEAHSTIQMMAVGGRTPRE